MGSFSKFYKDINYSCMIRNLQYVHLVYHIITITQTSVSEWWSDVRDFLWLGDMGALFWSTSPNPMAESASLGLGSPNPGSLWPVSL